jgi:cysteine synthase
VADARSRFTILCERYSRGVSEPDPAVLDLIGNTPLVRVTRLDTGPCALFLKLESQNPGGSIKDRIGLSMIDAAERDGRLKPGGVVVEATAGNTGLGLALVAAPRAIASSSSCPTRCRPRRCCT